MNIGTDSECLVIGITGHRILTDIDKIEAGIDEALKRIESACPGRPWKIVSALAEGADRLVVRRVLAMRPALLVVPLPLPEIEYKKDFRSAESIEEFDRLVRGAEVVSLPPVTTTEAAYLRAGDFVVDHADALICLWDGQQAQGQGGTANVVHRARERGLPIAWVRVGNRKLGSTEPTSLGTDQGRVSFEHIEILCLDKAIQRRDAHALRHKRRRQNLARFAIGLGPAAVLFLSLQVFVFPHGGGLAVGLLALELLALAIALVIGFLRIGRAHQLWIEARLRVELLRREKFLLRTRTGPYLRVDERLVGQWVNERLVVIDADISDPVGLLALEDENGRWRDALEDARNDPGVASIPNFPTCFVAYLDQRVVDQKQWFERKSIYYANQSRFYENGSKLILTLLLIVAALHLGLLAAGMKQPEGLHFLLIITVIVAPGVGSAFVGLQTISGSERLSRSYAFHARALMGFETRLRRIAAVSSMAPRRESLAEFEFKRIVLGTEDLLSNELRVWWLIMRSEAPGAVA